MCSSLAVYVAVSMMSRWHTFGGSAWNTELAKVFRSVTAKWLHELMCIEQQKCIKFVPIIVFERLYLAMYKINYAIYFCTRGVSSYFYLRKAAFFTYHSFTEPNTLPNIDDLSYIIMKLSQLYIHYCRYVSCAPCSLS